ncbi:ABC transporter ATP-binding protein [Cytobacillus sp. FJAT-54145]|uniref:ABC transporter ATP-binding protein n=1 Tax=Cytobacillus spartinae TaxID=3299023 RepID=A0ABW6KCQ7_9BACI
MSEYRLFFPYVKEQLKLYIFGFIGSLFRFLIPLSVPLIIKYIFDHLLQNKGLSYSDKIEELLSIAVIMLVIFLLLRAPMEYARQYFMHKANNNIIKSLRIDAFKKVHSLDAKYFTENKSGEIGTRFFDDIEKIRGFMTAAFSNIWIEIVVLVCVIGVMLTLNIQLTVLAVLLVGFQFLIAHLLSRRLKDSTRNMMNFRSVLSGFIFEKIQGAIIAKLFSSEKRDQKDLHRHLDAYEVLTEKNSRINAIMLSSVNVLSDLTPFVIVLVASLFVIEGRLTLGSLIAFFAYVDKMRSPVAALVQAIPTITEGRVALKRIFDFFNTPQTIKEQENPVELKNFSKEIKFQKVSFSYNKDKKILNNVSFTLEKGKTYAFVGESGGGKSTILQLLTRMYDTNSGEILIDGVNIKEYSLLSLRNHMGIVTQDNFLYSSSVKENLLTAKFDATDFEIISATQKAFAHDFISMLPKGYETEIGERGVKLSGGQKQRVSLARVFLKNPSIIILDEATSALDNESEKLVQSSINSLDNEKTIIMIAHRLTTILHADTIFVVKNGEIIESGNHQSLLSLNGYYKELYTKQAEQNEADKQTNENVRSRKIS